mgnify:CR=1 FL=1
MKPANCVFVFLLAMGCNTSLPPAEPSAPAKATVPPRADASPYAALLDGGEVFDGKVFKLKLPKGWEIIPDPAVALHARPAGNELFPNIKIALLPMPADATMEAFVSASARLYRRDGTVQDVAKATIQGREVHRILMTQDLPGNVNSQLKYLVPAGPQIMIFSGQGRPDVFESHLRLFDAVFRSLEVVPAAAGIPGKVEQAEVSKAKSTTDTPRVQIKITDAALRVIRTAGASLPKGTALIYSMDWPEGVCSIQHDLKFGLPQPPHETITVAGIPIAFTSRYGKFVNGTIIDYGTRGSESGLILTNPELDMKSIVQSEVDSALMIEMLGSGFANYRDSVLRGVIKVEAKVKSK